MTVQLSNTKLDNTLDLYLKDIIAKGEQFELEIRLGKIQENNERGRQFNTLLSSENYFDLLNDFKNGNEFIEMNDLVFYEIRKGQKRYRFDKNKNIFEAVSKKRMKVDQIRFPEKKYDLRFSIAKEKVVDSSGLVPSKSKAIRKKRTTFKYPYTQIDFTTTNRGKEQDRRVEIELHDVENSRESIEYVKDELIWILGKIL